MLGTLSDNDDDDDDDYDDDDDDGDDGDHQVFTRERSLEQDLESQSTALSLT